VSGAVQTLALVGANGMLATMLRKQLPPDYRLVAYDLPDLDIGDGEQVRRTFAAQPPVVIVNCAAYTNVDGCETETALANRVNGAGPGHLAAAAREHGATLVHISTDYVFDGCKASPYTEADAPNPLSAYGRSKLLGEEAIAASGLRRFFIVRTSWLYGPGGKNFVETIARLAGEREELRVVADQIGCPTYTGDLAAAVFQLLAGSAPYGIYHFSGAGECSWHAFAEAIVTEMRDRGLPVRTRRILPIRTEEYPLPAKRPAYSVFAKEKYRQATGAVIPDWRRSLCAYFNLRCSTANVQGGPA
jgi:dTDP-4-dehydrorhamnose reductase